MAKVANCKKCKYFYRESMYSNTIACCPKKRKIKTWQGLTWEIYDPTIKNRNGDCKDYKRNTLFSTFTYNHF